jgi:hypothetical protein
LFLILDQQLTEFSSKLITAAERKGLTTMFLTSADIAQNLALAFFLSDKELKLKLRFKGITVETTDINGVYCGINSFEPSLWNFFSQKDAEYAASETQALWLAILASLPCHVINPPALDTLAGTLLSTPEILCFAQSFGFKIPSVIYLESGKVTSELLAAGIPTRYADLGEVWINEKDSSQTNLAILKREEKHFRVTEEVSGKLFSVAIVGDRIFACTPDSKSLIKPITSSQIPHLIRTRLSALHNWLNLNMAEYYFRVTTDDKWIFSGCTRPPILATEAFGNSFFEHVVDFAVGGGK